jgi:hypothetical protein
MRKKRGREKRKENGVYFNKKYKNKKNWWNPEIFLQAHILFFSQIGRKLNLLAHFTRADCIARSSELHIIRAPLFFPLPISFHPFLSSHPNRP